MINSRLYFTAKHLAAFLHPSQLFFLHQLCNFFTCPEASLSPSAGFRLAGWIPEFVSLMDNLVGRIPSVKPI
jgi:hypothetical protein